MVVTSWLLQALLGPKLAGGHAPHGAACRLPVLQHLDPSHGQDLIAMDGTGWHCRDHYLFCVPLWCLDAANAGTDSYHVQVAIGWLLFTCLANLVSHGHAQCKSAKRLRFSKVLYEQGQLSSCFVVAMQDDSLAGIYNTLEQCAFMSKGGGGIGLSTSCIRAQGTPIRGTNGVSNGLVRMLNVFASSAEYVDQGGGKRKGAIRCDHELWHADVKNVLEMRRNNGSSLFHGVWMPSLFFERCADPKATWSFFCPTKVPGLQQAYGHAFNRLYEQYEKQGLASFTMNAREFQEWIAGMAIEAGIQLLSKDHSNRKSNHKHRGTILGSNLCTEIIQYHDKDETAVCNIASICLPKFMVTAPTVEVAKTFHSKAYLDAVVNVSSRALMDPDQSYLTRYVDHEELFKVVYQVVINLNAVIDTTTYPTPQAQRSSQLNRSIGLGISGLANLFAGMRLPFDSPLARIVNIEVMQTIHVAALSASCDLAKTDGHYEDYHWNGGSPASKGILQPDMWTEDLAKRTSGPVHVKLDHPTNRWNAVWKALRQNIGIYGLRNSLLVAPMPTASTAQIAGVNECFEPFTSNVYARTTGAGEFHNVCEPLAELMSANKLWTPEIRAQILERRGSIQGIDAIPDWIQHLFRTAWEIPTEHLLEMAADRGPYVCQSQSLNWFINKKTISITHICNLMNYAHELGLKTILYYAHADPEADRTAVTTTETKRTASTSTDVTNIKVAEVMAPKLLNKKSADLKSTEQFCTKSCVECAA